MLERKVKEERGVYEDLSVLKVVKPRSLKCPRASIDANGWSEGTQLLDFKWKLGGKYPDIYQIP